jgi:hypothetical protein
MYHCSSPDTDSVASFSAAAEDSTAAPVASAVCTDSFAPALHRARHEWKNWSSHVGFIDGFGT